MMIILGLLLAVLTGLLYAAIGWSAAWVIDILFKSVDVNYSIFVGIALVVWLICVLFVWLWVLAAKRLKSKADDFERDFNKEFRPVWGRRGDSR